MPTELQTQKVCAVSQGTASLPMYNRSELQAGNASYWQLLQRTLSAHGIQAPAYLTDALPGVEYSLRPDLCLTQTCGLPYRNYLHGKVSYVGTPYFAVPGCAPGYYRSVIIVRRDDQRRSVKDFTENETRLAVNSLDSQSGYAAIVNHEAGQLCSQAAIQLTGSHAASVKAVVCGLADLAAVDAVSWQFMQRYDDITDYLHVLAMTEPTPALPYISALTTDAADMFSAISEAVDSLPDDLRQLLGIRGYVWVDPELYMAVSTPPG